jgi:hypothetical protein
MQGDLIANHNGRRRTAPAIPGILKTSAILPLIIIAIGESLN